MLKRYYKEFDIQIPAAGAIVKQTFEVDKSVKYIYGVSLLSNRPDLLAYRGSLRLEINKDEIFPDGYSAVRLFSSVNVGSNIRAYDIGKNPSGNGLIKIEYTDTDDGRTLFAPYIISLCIDGEREDNA